MNLATLLLFWLVIGAGVGALADRVVHLRRKSLPMDIGTAIFGSLSAGMVFYILDVPRVANFTLWSIAASLAGACLTLFLLRMYQFGMD